MKSIKYLAIGMVGMIIIFGLLYGTNLYKVDGVITNVTSGTIKIEDELNNEWYYYTNDNQYTVGSKVELTMNSKDTDWKEDDEIVKIKLYE